MYNPVDMFSRSANASDLVNTITITITITIFFIEPMYTNETNNAQITSYRKQRENPKGA